MLNIYIILLLWFTFTSIFVLMITHLKIYDKSFATCPHHIIIIDIANIIDIGKPITCWDFNIFSSIYIFNRKLRNYFSNDINDSFSICNALFIIYDVEGINFSAKYKTVSEVSHSVRNFYKI